MIKLSKGLIFPATLYRSGRRPNLEFINCISTGLLMGIFLLHILPNATGTFYHYDVTMRSGRNRAILTNVDGPEGRKRIILILTKSRRSLFYKCLCIKADNRYLRFLVRKQTILKLDRQLWPQDRLLSALEIVRFDQDRLSWTLDRLLWLKRSSAFILSRIVSFDTQWSSAFYRTLTMTSLWHHYDVTLM